MSWSRTRVWGFRAFMQGKVQLRRRAERRLELSRYPSCTLFLLHLHFFSFFLFQLNVLKKGTPIMKGLLGNLVFAH